MPNAKCRFPLGIEESDSTKVKRTGMRLGYLPNFGEAMMQRGITRTVNAPPE